MIQENMFSKISIQKEATAGLYLRLGRK